MKIYYVSGEKSGDQLALWHVQKYWPHATIRGVGGAALAQVGTLDFRYDQFSCLGSLSMFWSLPRLYFLLKKIVISILAFAPDHLVLVNFSQPNLWLAQMLKKRAPQIHIIFFSPPQLWIWGSWRIKKIKKYIDQVEVIFPFEVEWYQKHGVRALYAGSPVLDRLLPAMHQRKPTRSVLCMLGSRRQELQQTVPLFFKALSLLQQKEPEISIVIPLADHSFSSLIQDAVEKYQLQKVTFIDSEQEVIMAMSSSLMALAKPGTNTLELALMGVPTIVAFSVPWVTYQFARWLIRPEFIALPNLLLKKEVFLECVQQRVDSALLASALHQLYQELQQPQKNDLFAKAAVDLQNMLQKGQE